MTISAHLQMDRCPACSARLVAHTSARAAVDLADDPETGAPLRLHVRVCVTCLPTLCPPPADVAARLRHALQLARHRVGLHDEQEQHPS